MSENTKLYWSSQKDISLKDAIELQKPNLENALCLFYSPNWCKFGKLILENDLSKSKQKYRFGKSGLNFLEPFLEISNTQNQLSNSPQLNSIFEARIFNEKCEMRWLNFSRGKGKAVFLSEAKETFSGFAKLLEPLEFLESLEQTYLLWGEGTGKKIRKGWSRLATARIGKLDVPIEGVKSNQRVKLFSKEYLGEVDEFGNVAVIEERLTKLEINQGKKVNDQSN